METKVVDLLKELEMTVTTVESCTGGLISGRLVNVAGVSDVFKEGYVTYSNKAKRKLVKVKKSTLKEYGAVSEKTAKEMAKGGLHAADADVAVAVTGIAGPDGGSEEKPVGLVYIAVAMKKKVCVKRYLFSGDRMEVRNQTVESALSQLYECLKDVSEKRVQVCKEKEQDGKDYQD